MVDCILNLPELQIAFSNLHDLTVVTNERKKSSLPDSVVQRAVYINSYVNWWASGNGFGSEMPMILGLGKFSVQADAWPHQSSWSFGRCTFGPSWWRRPNVGGGQGRTLALSTGTRWRHARWQGPEPQLWQCSCLLPILCPPSPVALHVGDTCPYRTLEQGNYHPWKLLCVETELNMFLIFYSHPVTTGYISRDASHAPVRPGLSVPTQDVGQHCSHQDTYSAWHISFVATDTEWQ